MIGRQSLQALLCGRHEPGGHVATINPGRARLKRRPAQGIGTVGELAMELSIREAKARFAEAAAAARGERVVVTKHGHPFVELVPAQGVSGMNFDEAAIVRRELGLDGSKVSLPPDLDDSAFSRRVLGLPD